MLERTAALRERSKNAEVCPPPPLFFEVSASKSQQSYWIFLLYQEGLSIQPLRASPFRASRLNWEHISLMRSTYQALRFSSLFVLSFGAACTEDSESSGSGDGSGSGGRANDDIVIGDGDLPSDPGATGGGTGAYQLPEGFTEAERGGYALGEEIVDGVSLPTEPPETDGGCGTEIVGVVRDFMRGDVDGGHPDFQTFTGSGETGIVEPELGDDQKPVYVPGDHTFTTTEENFNQWYRNVEGVNHAYLVYLSFEPNGDVLTFQSTDFFPLDDEGYGNQGHENNFSFTTEIHTEFLYKGGETFSFTGDDDLWVFINDRLAIDLGGLHSELTDTVVLDDAADELGLVVGNTYALDLFHAERHTGESNFRVDTNLEFTSCAIVLDQPVR